MLVMRWVHDLESFNKLSVKDQQDVIGRTKPDSIELSDKEKPKTAHIARVSVEVKGAELENSGRASLTVVSASTV